MITDENFKDLETKGYTVVSDVINKQECDQAIADYKTWLAQFGDRFPKTFQSIINDYNAGHLEVTWRLRLQAKPVFAQLWNTDKLLTSFDAIGIGRPPEDGVEAFQDVSKYWLHADFTPSRIGLHAYQGALYLEEQTKSDWTFQVIEGSHQHLEDLFVKHPETAKRAKETGFYVDMTEDDIEFFKRRGCRVTRVPVPKGGMALWDSRLIHANARPLPNRKNKGRWRYVTFISMTPAIWANEEDIRKHREAYEQPVLTTHWSSQGLRHTPTARAPDITFPETVPDIAHTEEAMRLSGMLPYDYKDGKPNGEEMKPVWKRFEQDVICPELDKEIEYANGHI